jgi:hypothetical protein
VTTKWGTYCNELDTNQAQQPAVRQSEIKSWWCDIMHPTCCQALIVIKHKGKKQSSHVNGTHWIIQHLLPDSHLLPHVYPLSGCLGWTCRYLPLHYCKHLPSWNTFCTPSQFIVCFDCFPAPRESNFVGFIMCVSVAVSLPLQFFSFTNWLNHVLPTCPSMIYSCPIIL